ncbi:hypothetical protein R1T08_05460 [Streptomyces sp. SBC-4]|nr:hypothetical protein [Streptomyces sp. SBC-4]MDV5143735.1 hypothetical protein [Streptomyces sp. SBC-4]
MMHSSFWVRTRGLAIPHTRRASARATAVLLTVVVPANEQMACGWRHRPTTAKAVAYAPLPLQVPLIRWARQTACAAG